MLGKTAKQTLNDEYETDQHTTSPVAFCQHGWRCLRRVACKRKPNPVMVWDGSLR